MKGLFYFAMLVFSVSASTQELKNYETICVSETTFAFASLGEDGQTPSGEEEWFRIILEVCIRNSANAETRKEDSLNHDIFIGDLIQKNIFQRFLIKWRKKLNINN